MSKCQTMQISGETACHELSYLNLHCLQKTLLAFGSERVNPFPHTTYLQQTLLKTIEPRYKRAPPKKHPCEVLSKLAKWLMRRCLFMQYFMNDGWKLITIFEHFMLRWAKKITNNQILSELLNQKQTMWKESKLWCWKGN